LAAGLKPPDKNSWALVAEDDPDIAGLLTLRLARAGFQTAVAQDGQEALRLAHERRPTIAFIDIRMAKLNGYEVTRRIRADDDLRAMSVVIVSASVKESSTAESLAAGADAHIRKPFAVDEIDVEIAKVLK
jgi:DNA-binding response OmpR family regulator